MPSPVRITAAVAQILAAFLTDPETDRHGLDIMHVTGLPAGTLYPILTRLQGAGWVTAAWEDIDTEKAGRPARRSYRLTPHGLAAARTEITALRAQLGGPGTAPGKPGKPWTV